MSKKPDTWMPLYIGDYLADTSRLTTEQHGAYLLLLMDYWRNGPPLDDDEELATITKLPVAAWRKHAAKIRGFFTSVDGRLISKRGDQERQRAGLVSSKRSEAGKAGAAARWGREEGKAGGKPVANAMANASDGHRQNDAPSQSQSQGTTEPDGSSVPAGASPTVSPMGAMCLRLKGAGILPEPGHEDFKALVEDGAKWEEFEPHVDRALQADKPFRYLVGMVVGARGRAARRGPLPPAPPPRDDRKSRQLSTAALMTGAGRPTTEPETLDVDARVIAPRSLG